MAVVTVKSTAITNRDATPRVLSNARYSKGNIQCLAGTAEAANGDSIASKYILGTVPSNARIHQVLLSCDALGGSAAGDVGIYRTTADGSAVVDADHFSTAKTLVSALKNVDVTFDTANYNIDEVEMPIWQALGLTADPKVDYDIVVTLTAASAAAGTISLQALYAI